ncbi:MAG: PAC2 family protein [Thermodesulfobacteriota bacterium]
MTGLIFHQRPELKRPAMIVAFSGWPNAGDVATGTLEYLENRLQPKPLAFLASDQFLDFTEVRPTARIKNGRIREFHAPVYNFTWFTGSIDQSDLILLRGPEPRLNWSPFCDLVLKLAGEMNVRVIVTLGGTYDYVPHWLPARVSAIYSDQAAEEMALTASLRLNLGEYQGPVSIHTLILDQARALGLPAIGLWGHAPVYIQTGNLKLHQALVDILKKLVGFDLDASDLETGVKEMERQIDDLVAKNPELKKYLADFKQEHQGPSTRRPRPAVLDSGGRERGKVISLDSFLRRDDS